jgi:hypothetical protein
MGFSRGKSQNRIENMLGKIDMETFGGENLPYVDPFAFNPEDPNNVPEPFLLPRSESLTRIIDFVSAAKMRLPQPL